MACAVQFVQNSNTILLSLILVAGKDSTDNVVTKSSHSVYMRITFDSKIFFSKSTGDLDEEDS